MTTPLSLEAVREQLTRILASAEFKRAERLSALLAFIVHATLEGRADSLKEYVLALEVLGRGSRYDPQRDPIVRVQARQLRLRLAAYYETSGRQDPVLIEIPAGRYVAAFRWREARSAPAHLLPTESDAVAEAGARARRSPWWQPVRRAWAIGAGLAAVVVFALVWFQGERPQRASGPPSVAVLPFVNVGELQGDEYFSDGLTDELIDRLARLEGLRVVARTSAFSFKGRAIDVRDVGRRLGVAHVLEGTVRREGHTVRISARLSRTSDGTTVWTASFDRQIETLLAVQDEVARAIAAVLSVRLSPVDAAARSPVDPEVHDLYLRARHLWNQRSEEALRLSVDLYERAIARDPAYAPAHAGLSAAWLVMQANGLATSAEAAPRARAAAEQALTLDSTVSPARAVLASLEAYEYAWESSNRRFEEALAQQPGDATSHHWYGLNLAALGRLPQALAELERARALDPLSMPIAYSIGEVYYYMRRFDAAVEQAHAIEAVDPQYGGAFILKARALAALGDYDGALAAAGRTFAPELFRAGVLAADVRRRAEARRIAASLADTDLARRMPFAIACIYAQLGDRDAAFRWLFEAWRTRQADIISLKIDPTFDRLRHERQYLALVRALGLEPAGSVPARLASSAPVSR